MKNLVGRLLGALFLCALGLAGCGRPPTQLIPKVLAIPTSSAAPIATSTPTASPIASSTPSPSPTDAHIVQGTIVGLNSPTQVNIDAPGCGYVNVNFNASTPIEYYGGVTLKTTGAAILVWGKGGCKSSFTATRIVVSAGSINQASPAPTPTCSP